MLLKALRLLENTRKCSSENRLRPPRAQFNEERRQKTESHRTARGVSLQMGLGKKKYLEYDILEDIQISECTWIRKELGAGLNEGELA